MVGGRDKGVLFDCCVDHNLKGKEIWSTNVFFLSVTGGGRMPV